MYIGEKLGWLVAYMNRDMIEHLGYKRVSKLGYLDFPGNIQIISVIFSIEDFFSNRRLYRPIYIIYIYIFSVT